ncbi:MAG: peptidoglycan editing factor PgeF [Gammaproteobacteria bacterium]
MSNDGLVPDWPAPPRVRAFTTTRQGGVSPAPYASLNLGGHVGDAPQAVAANRTQVVRQLGLPGMPLWLNQVHGITVVDAAHAAPGCAADASFTREPGVVCAVLTADCLPLLLCDKAGSTVAAVHAGWRGLAAGVIEVTLAAMQVPPEDLMVWLGPAIGPHAFEVGSEVREAFTSHDSAAAEAFHPSSAGCWLADIYQLARQRLARQGVTAVYGGERCTYTEAQHFYSYRRDDVTGRMASLIWIE